MLMGRGRDKWDHAFERGVFPERQDVLLLGSLPVIALAAWLAPETAWLPMSKGAARVSGPLNRKRDENARIIAALLSDRLRPHGAAAVAEEIGAHHHHSRGETPRILRFALAWTVHRLGDDRPGGTVVKSAG